MDELRQRFAVAPFATIRSVRTTFALDGCKIDVDETDFGYRIGEIEIVVKDETELDAARRRLKGLSERLGLQSGGVRGKIVEHMRRFAPEHFRELIDCGVISSSQLRDLE